MTVLEVRGLCKSYPGFQLKNVGFAVQRGQIMGFIGRNGAGKTTTLKSLVNIVHPASGSVRFFGQEFVENEAAIKQRIGFALGGANYYSRKRIGTITAVYKRFYPGWSDETYRRYLARFALDENKRVAELSQGMRVKYALALALSHKAQLLLLDEPTSGLDPVSRDDLLELFLDLAGEGTSILFSTHLTPDLGKCAEAITYIKEGGILASTGMKALVESYRLVKGSDAALDSAQRAALIGCKSRKGEFNALVPTEAAGGLAAMPGVQVTAAALEDIMVYIERE